MHFPRPVTRYWAEMHPGPFQRGVLEFMSYYGMLLETMDWHYINGFAYRQPRPVPDEEVPQRFARAEEVFEKKLWRQQLRDWDETFKPASIKTHRELQSVDPEALSDDDLIAYLTRCRDHHAEMIYQPCASRARQCFPSETCSRTSGTGRISRRLNSWT